MTRAADLTALTGLALLALAVPVVAIAGPIAGVWTAAVGVALCLAGGVAGWVTS